MTDFPAPGVPLRLSGTEPFEGPLDVLLAILGDEPDRILTVPLAEVTAQYLAWLDTAAEHSLASKVEFVETGVYLIRLKTSLFLEELRKGMLPIPAAAGEPDPGEESPPEELQRLAEQLRARERELAAERQRFRQIAEALQNGELAAASSLPRGRDLTTEEPTHRKASDLLVHIRQARRWYAQPRPAYTVVPDPVTERELHAWLSDRVRERAQVDFTVLMAERGSKREQCLLFSALLQGCKAAEWTVEQSGVFENICVTSRLP